MSAVAIQDLIRAPVAHRRSTRCECGREKTCEARSCARCRYLDGETPKQHAVIAALRGTDGLPVRELCLLVDGRCDDVTYVSMQRTVAALVAQGRLRRYWLEDDGVTQGNAFGRGYAARASRGCWAYALDGIPPVATRYSSELPSPSLAHTVAKGSSSGTRKSSLSCPRP